MNTMHKYKVGDKVRYFNNRTDLGTVVEVVDDDEIHVKWDSDSEIGLHDPHEIAPYDPEGDALRAQRAQEKIDEATHSLEAAFKAWAGAQNEYADREGQDVAYSMKQDELIDLKDFEGVLNVNGWSTSSLYC